MSRIRPFNGAVNISQEYGVKSSIYRRGYHSGVDYSMEEGREIVAPENGEIVRNGDGTSRNDGRGYYIVLKGDSGIYHQLFHLKQMGHASGRVETGQVIGYSGNTGLTSGPHLHWETTRADDRNSDFAPSTWLFANNNFVPPVSVPQPQNDFVRIFGDYRSLYRGPGTDKFAKIEPIKFGGHLDYKIIERNGNFVKIQTQMFGQAWVYVGAEVSHLTQYYKV